MLKLTVLERSFQTKSYQKEEERQKINELGNKQKIRKITTNIAQRHRRQI